MTPHELTDCIVELLTPSKSDPPAIAYLKHLCEKEISLRDDEIERLQGELSDTAGRLETAEQNMRLLKASIVCVAT